MNELLNKINDTLDNSINTSNDDAVIQLKILKGNINTLFKDAMETNNNSDSVNVEPITNKKNILVVDDSSIIRNYIEKICSSKYNVLLANNGEEAISSFDDNNIDLLLLDIMMPGVDGFGVLEYLKSKNQNLPVIIISGDTTKETIDRAFTYNVIDMIEKPFSEKTIIEKINRVLE